MKMKPTQFMSLTLLFAKLEIASFHLRVSSFSRALVFRITAFVIISGNKTVLFRQFTCFLQLDAFCTHCRRLGYLHPSLGTLQHTYLCDQTAR